MGQLMIPARLRQAFSNTHYRVQSPAGAFVLQVGRRSAVLAQSPRAANESGSVLVTAWNPAGRRRGLAANRAAERRFGQRLRAWGIKSWPALAQDPKRLWPDERGALLFGVPQGLAADLGRALGQRAVLYIGTDAVPRLLWL
jgi:Protein of unknown function (DUF3293)